MFIFLETMNPERTIKITHKNADGNLEQIEVKMLYCAASETGFQSLSGETVDVFTPVFDTNEKGKVYVKEPPRASDMNYIQLAIACIVSAYEREGEQPPIATEDILYNATHEEIIQMTKNVVEMRAEWLFVPSTVSEEMKPNKGGKAKNASTPTKHSKRS